MFYVIRLRKVFDNAFNAAPVFCTKVLHHVQLPSLLQPVHALLILLSRPHGIRNMVEAFVKFPCDTLCCFNNILLQINDAHLLTQLVDVIGDLLREHVRLTNANPCTKCVQFPFASTIGEGGQGGETPRHTGFRWCQ